MTDNAQIVDGLLATLGKLQLDFQDKLPPVESWNPPLSGDIDIRIDREGNWSHEGSPMKRAAMVKMFSSILKREGAEYFLITPVEKWRIQVDEQPFVFLSLRQEIEDAQTAIVLTTNTGLDVVVSENYPFWVEKADNGEPRPICRVYRNLNGLLSRSAFYQLVDLCQQETSLSGEIELVFKSMGTRFSLGTI